MTSATTVDLCINWRTPNRDQSWSTEFTIQKMKCKLLFFKGRVINDSDYCLFLDCDVKPDRPFDVSVHLIVGSDVVSHCRTTVRSADLIWKGDFLEMSKVLPDFKQRELLFKVVVYDSAESGCSRRTTEEKFLLNQASENTNLGVDSLIRDLEKLLEQEDSYADVQLWCGDREFKAHKCLLSSRSQVFASMFRSEMLEGKTGRVEIRDTEADIFGHFLRYLYTGKLPKLTTDTYIKLYETSDCYKVDALKTLCRLFLTKNLAPHNACDVLLLADRHSDPDLKESTISYMVDQRIPHQDNVWQPFSTNHPVLAVEVLNRFCRLIPPLK